MKTRAKRAKLKRAAEGPLELNAEEEVQWNVEGPKHLTLVPHGSKVFCILVYFFRFKVSDFDCQSDRHPEVV